jgi:hypothetical protein
MTLIHLSYEDLMTYQHALWHAKNQRHYEAASLV